MSPLNQNFTCFSFNCLQIKNTFCLSVAFLIFFPEVSRGTGMPMNCCKTTLELPESCLHPTILILEQYVLTNFNKILITCSFKFTYMYNMNLDIMIVNPDCPKVLKKLLIGPIQNRIIILI